MFGNRQTAGAMREKRRARRANVNAPAVVQTTAARLHATIVNISASGARLVASDCPPSRQDVQIVVNGVRLFGRIAWRRDKAFGVKFDDGIQDYTAAQILRAVEEASVPVYEFDRDAILAGLANQQPTCECAEAEADG